MEPGTLAKTLNDFFTTEEDELSLKKGDIFLIHKIIDKHWCFGQSHNKVGKFPTNYLHKVEVPEINSSESLFISIDIFKSEQPDGLSFDKGEIIVGNLETSSGLINGHIGSRKGIISSSYLWQLDLNLMQNSLKKKIVKRKAKVDINLKAQLNEELNLIKGEIIMVTEILNDGWCRGYKENGEEGIFPESFITYLKDSNFVELDKKSTTLSLDERYPLSFIPQEICKQFIRSNPNTVDLKYDDSLPNYNDIFSDINLSNDQIASDYDSFEFKSFAITQYTFTAEYPNELSFRPGQIIKLIKNIDDEWAEGMINNVTGIFPISFVKLNCVESQYEMIQSDVSMLKNNLQFNDHDDNKTFETEKLTKADSLSYNWVAAINDQTETHICPTNYSSTNFNSSNKDLQNILEDFGSVTDKKKDSIENEIEQTRKLSKPHRLAPPVPTLTQVTIQNIKKQTIPSKKNINISFSTKRKRVDQRQNVVTELYLTEKVYVRDLKMTYEVFNLHDPSFLKSKGIDVNILFGNILEIIDIAEKFLELIQQAMKDCDEEYQNIGSCFLKISEKMRIAYGKYCSNHELSLALLQKYEDKEEIMKIFNKGVETLRIQVVCFDMNSILIKPVQRILKYSLFLNKLLKFTEDDHPDKPMLAEATKVMEDVARFINEYKKKKEVSFKYLHSNNTFIGKIANLNMHSVAKKSSRLGAKLSATLGLTNLPIDLKFDELVKDFVSLEKSTKQLLKDVNQCISYLYNESLCAEILTEHLYQYFERIPNNEILMLQKVTNIIRSRFIKHFKTCIELRVISPLNILVTLLAGPEVLINKRHDKMLDYDTAISRNEKSKEKGIILEDLSSAKSNFEVLNQQLLEELPIFIETSTAILYNCINAFTNARKLYSAKIMNQYLNISEYVNQVSMKDTLENFLVNHNLLYNQIRRFTYDITNTGFNEDSIDYCLQSSVHRMILKMNYSPNKLYVVTRSISSATSHDLSVTKGTIVGVIKTQNPMGDTSKWFVDNGFLKGFLESQYLELSNEAKLIEETSSVACTNNSFDLISLNSPNSEVNKYSTDFDTLYTNINEELNTNFTSKNAESEQFYENVCEFVHALCDFNDTKNSGTLSIRKGQTLKVLKKHDNKKNPQWWLVEDRAGGKGYIPYNYIQNKEA